MPLRVSRVVEKETTVSSTSTIQFDDVAFEILFRNNFTSLCSYCQLKFGFDIDHAKEAVHTGFVKLWESRQQLSVDLSIKSYLHKCITNTCLDMLRHQKVRHKHERLVLEKEAGNLHDPFDNADIKSLSADIDKAVSELPEQMKRIFELSRYEGFRYAEISAHLNISVKTVETQMSRALVKLREKLSNYLPLILCGTPLSLLLLYK